MGINNSKMKRTEYIEYFEADDNKNIKEENFEENTGIKRVTSESNEYFEEDFKTENKGQFLNNLCNICQKQYKSKRSLSTHIQSDHRGIKYPCIICEYKATAPGNLKQHIESVHENIKYH